ncbi:MAG: hypothetical protein ACNA7V_07775 [Bacteroidales bacterium]
MEKKRIVTSMDKITPEIKKLIAETYPFGWKNNVIRINKPNGEFFHAIPLNTPEIAYLIKVQVKVDSKTDLEKEEQKGFSSESESDDSDNAIDSADEPDIAEEPEADL